MTDAVLISIVTSTAAVLMATVSAYFAHRAKVAAVETHEIVNSRMTSFMAMAEKAFRAEGVAQEKKDASVRAADAIVSRAAGVIITPQVVVAPGNVTDLAKAVEAVPDKTAVKVVEKLEEQKGK